MYTRPENNFIKKAGFKFSLTPPSGLGNYIMDDIGPVNLYSSLDKFSRQQICIFLIFPSKQNLTIHAKCPHKRQFA